MNNARIIAGASRPADNVYAIKIVAADSMALRQAIFKVRAMVYSHWESPEPSLRKL